MSEAKEELLRAVEKVVSNYGYASSGPMALDGEEFEHAKGSAELFRAIAELSEIVNHRAPVAATALPQKDACAVCHGERGGVPGNENIIAGVVMCDYCHAASMENTVALPPNAVASDALADVIRLWDELTSKGHDPATLTVSGALYDALDRLEMPTLPPEMEERIPHAADCASNNKLTCAQCGNSKFTQFHAGISSHHTFVPISCNCFRAEVLSTIRTLQAQLATEPVTPVVKGGEYGNWTRCACFHVVGRHMNFCPNCGKPIKWEG